MKCSGNCRGRLDYSFDLSFPIDSTNHQLSPFLASAQPVAPLGFLAFASEIEGRVRSELLSAGAKNRREAESLRASYEPATKLLHS